MKVPKAPIDAEEIVIQTGEGRNTAPLSRLCANFYFRSGLPPAGKRADSHSL